MYVCVHMHNVGVLLFVCVCLKGREGIAAISCTIFLSVFSVFRLFLSEIHPWLMNSGFDAYFIYLGMYLVVQIATGLHHTHF